MSDNFTRKPNTIPSEIKKQLNNAKIVGGIIGSFSALLLMKLKEMSKTQAH